MAPFKTLGKMIAVGVLLGVSSPLFASVCPSDFHQLPVMENASYCQLFDDKLPASLSYHANQSPQQALAFYQQLTDISVQTEKDRQVIRHASGNWLLIISADGEGSQIDMLVKQ
ncbi:hypothetical protein P2G88_09580 [Aliiglaciecola sp. CAU 1673]|uniref:hypothetical protein n=1 Tax=Aliiglaciecola sp. CAU 1673 TaxID=3032595 RepID=UPI0023DA1D8B|nr:hypothetical protein [Aliiglaciecola sp. CAU 1673]MDF2178503.1 hypothetical protein [Aliiglaciecola sp. CAU 1673]